MNINAETAPSNGTIWDDFSEHWATFAPKHKKKYLKSYSQILDKRNEGKKIDTSVLMFK